jgi:hypothetical protein
VDEAGLAARRLKSARMVEFDADVHIALQPFHREGVVAGVMIIGETHGAEHMRELLEVNLQHRLSYFTGSTGPPELDARVRIPVDPFDREGLLLGLQSLAELLDALVDEDTSELVARIRAARRAPAGAPGPALRSALEELELTGAQRADDVWRIETTRGLLDAVLHPEGETWMLLQPIEFEFDRSDEGLLCWLLDASGSRGARLGLRDEPDGPSVFATIVLPAGGLGASSLAYGVEQALRLGEESLARSSATSSRDDPCAAGRAHARHVAYRRPPPVARRERRRAAVAGVALRRRGVARRRPRLHRPAAVHRARDGGRRGGRAHRRGRPRDGPSSPTRTTSGWGSG